jgi:hypothetical protein
VRTGLARYHSAKERANKKCTTGSARSRTTTHSFVASFSATGPCTTDGIDADYELPSGSYFFLLVSVGWGSDVGIDVRNYNREWGFGASPEERERASSQQEGGGGTSTLPQKRESRLLEKPACGDHGSLLAGEGNRVSSSPCCTKFGSQISCKTSPCSP